MIYNMYIFNRDGACLFYREWHRSHRTVETPEADQKLMFGFLFSLKQIVNKLTPQNGMPGFHACQTNKFKLNYFETASGLRFVLNTDLQAGDMRECLRHIYGGLYVEYASKNALYKLGEPLDNELFVQSVDQYIRSLPSFAS